ncbi:MAG: peptidoglycan D,D-transpeptidase FtsI family protein [Akkermansiaceae bacterium]
MKESSVKFRAFIICLVLVAGLSALSVRLISIQVWDRKLSDKSSITRFILEERIPASRGAIVDRNDIQIARNLPEAALIADVNHLYFHDHLTRAVAHRFASRMSVWDDLEAEEKARLLTKVRIQRVNKMDRDKVREEHLAYALEVIGRELRIPASQLRDRISTGEDKNKKRIVVEKRIREDQARRIEEALQARRIQGFSFERSQRRYYTKPTLAPHLIGFIDHSGFGQTGIEKSMQNILSGIDGERELKRDDNGLVNLTEPKSVLPAKHGKHVKMTLDMGLQDIIEYELQQACQAYGTNRGSIIVVDPHTGDILAMASRPYFDLNVRKNFENAANNFAIATEYEAGSVLKLVAMSAALNERVAHRGTEVHCGWGRIQRRGYRVIDHHAYGDLTFDEVMMKSSNAGAFLFAEMVGREKFYKYLHDFGFGQATGFPVRGEGTGYISDSANMQNFASATYGYGLSVTPIQLAMAYSAIANGGTLMRPRLVDSVIARNGRVVEVTPIKAVRRVLSERAAREMRLSLEQVVIDGTGRRADVPGFRAAGKTGTAWKWNNKLKKYEEHRKHLTFAGMVPVEEPKFVCVVTFDEAPVPKPEDVGGGTIAAPVFSQIARRVAAHLNLPVTEPIEEKEGSIAFALEQ